MSDQRPWYKKKRYIISGFIVGAFIILTTITAAPIPASVNSRPSNAGVITSQQNSEFKPTQNKSYSELSHYNTTVQQIDIAPSSVGNNNSGTLSNNTYQDVSSDIVHSPAYSETDQVPARATAQCGDGTYSFSQHRSGTCSHHGGVEQWLQ